MIINKVHSHIKASHNVLINKNISPFSQMKDKLSLMFSDKQFVMKLSSMTRVYPEYYTTKMIKPFLQSVDQAKYSKYISKYNNMHKEKVNHNQSSKDEQTDDQNIAVVEDYNNRPTTSQQLFQCFSAYRRSLPILDCYIDWLMKQKLTPQSDEYYKNKCIMEMFDMRNPQNWFTNSQKRHFIYHHGPTNSGKTSSAIKQLKQLPKDKKGIYMAPLRLLAWEMQQKLQNCNLITGQDKQFRVSNLTSCTIQALNTNEQYDVAIIDEIQMIGDFERGWSWTKAILSTKAKKIHLCGDERAIGLVSKLIRDCGGTLEQRKYSRLGKLKLIPKIFQMSAIQEGDCMIEFSVETLHKLRRKIRNQINAREKSIQSSESVENKTINDDGHENKLQTSLVSRQQGDQKGQGKKQQVTSQTSTNKKPCNVAMVYGRLPPQCRKQQARKFNKKISPYLVATNAIGMGLNLNIKKIIFAGIKRRNSRGQEVQLQQHQIQQIAGRAGRGLNDGLVQCASYEILKKVRKALRNVNKTYGINLQDQQLQQESSLVKGQDNDNKQVKSNNINIKIDDDNDNDNEQENQSQKLININNMITYKKFTSNTSASKKATNTKKGTQSLKNYDNFLNRVLTKKQRSIQRAGLFVQYIFLKRMKSFIEQHYNNFVPLHESIKLYLNLSLQSSDMYVLSQKTQLLQWLQRLSKQHMFQSRDTFEIAKCLSMHYNSFYSRQKMWYFAKMFKRKKAVPLPIDSIKKRNEKKCLNNYTKLDILQSNYSVAQVYINLWNKYQFIFNQLQTAKQIKQEIAQLIKDVLEDEQGFSFNQNKNKDKKITEQQQKQQNSQFDERENIRQTILDQQTSDIEQIKIGNS